MTVDRSSGSGTRILAVQIKISSARLGRLLSKREYFSGMREVRKCGI
jgi:hypothetical protein